MNACPSQRLLPFFLLVIIFLAGCADEAAQPRAKQGVLDLSRWDFHRDGSVALDGPWEFSWHRLAVPTDFTTANLPATSSYFPIPAYWNGHRVNGRALPGNGYATFRLKVRLKPGQRDLALRIQDQASAYRFWINGILVAKNGTVGKDAAATVPGFRIVTAAVPAAAELDCLLQVANWPGAGPTGRSRWGTLKPSR